MVLARTGPTLLVAAALVGPVISSRVEFVRIASPPSANLPMGERRPASPGVVGLPNNEADDLVSGNRYLSTFPGRVDVSTVDRSGNWAAYTLKDLRLVSLTSGAAS